MKSEKDLLSEIERLKEELEDRKKALPAHSIRPHQLLIIDELEEKIEEKKKLLKQIQETG